MGVHIQLEPAVKVDVSPEQGRQAAPVGVGEPACPVRGGQHVLDHAGVEVGDGGLDQVQGECRCLDILLVVAGELAGLAVEDVLALFQFSTTFRPSWISRRSCSLARYSQMKMVRITRPGSSIAW